MPYTKKQVTDGRKVVDNYRLAHSQLYLTATHRSTLPQEHYPLIQKMQDDLKKLGFASDDDFRQANYEQNVKDTGFKSITDFEAKATEAQIEEVCRMWV